MSKKVKDSQYFRMYVRELRMVFDDCFPKGSHGRKSALVFFGTAVDRILELMTAFGGCIKCWGKGYGTQTATHTFSSTYAGSYRKTYKLDTMVFCTCDRGKQLSKLCKNQKK